MSINVITWRSALSAAAFDNTVGIAIAPLSEYGGRGTFVTEIMPGKAVSAHYHRHGGEDYHIIEGSGILRLVPAEALERHDAMSEIPVTKGCSFTIEEGFVHQLVNQGSEPLILIFSCPHAHLKDDRFVVELLDRPKTS